VNLTATNGFEPVPRQRPSPRPSAPRLQRFPPTGPPRHPACRPVPDQSARFRMPGPGTSAKTRPPPGRTPSHYLSAGNYTVRLTASNLAGSNTVTKTHTSKSMPGLSSRRSSKSPVWQPTIPANPGRLHRYHLVVANTSGSVVTLTGVGNGWAVWTGHERYPEISDPPSTGPSPRSGPGPEITVPIPAVGSPKVHLELALDKLPPQPRPSRRPLRTCGSGCQLFVQPRRIL
jgi:hypothetical protein